MAKENEVRNHDRFGRGDRDRENSVWKSNIVAQYQDAFYFLNSQASYVYH